MCDTGTAQAEMPKYRCHKEAWALKIKCIESDLSKAHLENRETDGHAMLIPYDDRYSPIKVDARYMAEHEPKVDGYYVVYDGGYKSWSPAKAFEDGYILIE